MKEQKKKHLFTNRQLAALLIPLALDQLLNSFMGTVDTLIVSNIGSAAISAVSLVDAINILVVEAFLALTFTFHCDKIRLYFMPWVKNHK